MTERYVSDSPDNTKAIGRVLGSFMKGGEIICLYGDLGAGKTSLSQGILAGAGISEEESPGSPTYTLMNNYMGRFPVCHVDLYRVEQEDDLYDIGLDEILSTETTLCIEWAEKLGVLTPPDRIDIHMNFIEVDKREIIFSPKGNTLLFFRDFGRKMEEICEIAQSSKRLC